MNESGEEIVDDEEAESPSLAIKKLRERLAAAVKEKQDYLDGWQRARADFVNFKRDESGRDLEKEFRLKSEFALSVIPSLDAFEMAFKSPSFQHAAQEWRAGMASLYSELLKSLSKLGIMSFSPVGEHFNPTEHEAVLEILVSEKDKEHRVMSVERSGYKVGDKIIRPAQVQSEFLPKRNNFIQ